MLLGQPSLRRFAHWRRSMSNCHDAVNRPKHYTSHPSGVECVTIAEHFGFNVGNAIKYVFRCEHKGRAVEDLRKSAWYLRREADRLERKTVRRLTWDAEDGYRATSAAISMLEHEPAGSALRLVLGRLLSTATVDAAELREIAATVEGFADARVGR